ncbi:MAG: hypothetical protein IJN92_04590 [Lachnospiraceae bacterium]|nr:hypothetical protein [Lachnospiraceae bacterium]
MLGQVICIIIGVFCIISLLRIFSDYFVAINPMFHGIIKKAKIVGFFTDCTWKAVAEFSIIEFYEGNKIIHSKIERAKDDQIGQTIAVLQENQAYTVRRFFYIPYDIAYKLRCVGTVFLMFIIQYLYILKEDNLGMWLSIIIGGISVFLYYPFWVYKMFYKNSGKKIKDAIK